MARVMKMNLRILFMAFAVACWGYLLAAPQARASLQGSRIINTPHNLAVSGGGGAHGIKSTSETRICIFCHTPHHAVSDGPLWSRQVPAAELYTQLYTSDTLTVTTKPPRSLSRLCLGCHDGTIALGQLTGGYKPAPDLKNIKDYNSAETDPDLKSWLDSDLSDDHPISFVYPTPAQNSEINPKETLPAKGINLDHATDGDYVECTSCHDPHNNQYGNFLVVNTATNQDALCTACHNIAGWNSTDNAHDTTTDSGSGCMTCHIPHNAQSGGHLLRSSSGDEAPIAVATLPQVIVKYFLQTVALASRSMTRAQQNALGQERGSCYTNCHKQVSNTDIWNQFNSMAYSHPVGTNSQRHSKNESLPVSDLLKHVVCVDCHNPHRARQKNAVDTLQTSATVSSTPFSLSGSLLGVRGVDLSGTAVVSQARYEYEICFKCHSGMYAGQFTALSDQRPIRLFPAFDLSLRFSTSSPSSHPMVADRLGTGRSLITSLQTSMLRIVCTDCHHPHGSNEQHILRAQNYDVYPSVTTDYPLCFRCHSRDFLLNTVAAPHSGSATLHSTHVGTHRVPCSACHDPHGVPTGRGATTSSGAHLINFDTRYAGQNASYSASAKSCTVSCHATNPQTY